MIVCLDDYIQLVIHNVYWYNRCMHTLRTRFAKDIVCEFLPPTRPQKKDKILILCDGMPSVPKKKELMEFFARKGFWVFHPRYRGSWESGGVFLAQSPHDDILDVIDGIHKPFTSFAPTALEKAITYRLKPTNVIVLGGSFGGPAALLASMHPKVTKAIALCAVVDWNHIGKDEPLDWMGRTLHDAFGEGYRYTKKTWSNLGKKGFYNPVDVQEKIDGSKILILHAQDDPVVPYAVAKKFATSTHAQFISLLRGGHISSALLMKPTLWKKVRKFLSSRA